jgi:hypothetical protein
MNSFFSLIFEPVYPAYNPSFQFVFSAGTIFFSHNKSTNSVFQPAYQHSRTGPFSPADTTTAPEAKKISSCYSERGEVEREKNRFINSTVTRYNILAVESEHPELYQGTLDISGQLRSLWTHAACVLEPNVLCYLLMVIVAEIGGRRPLKSV